MEPFSIMIPVYNEGELIVRNTERLKQFLNRLDITYEIVIASNGSRDSTVELGKMLEKKHRNIRFFHIKKREVGQAFKKAVKIASYENLISLDMDLSIDLSFIEEANSLLRSYNIVVGSKKVGKQRRPIIRRVGSSTYIFFSRKLLGLKFNDYSLYNFRYNLFNGIITHKIFKLL